MTKAEALTNYAHNWVISNTIYIVSHSRQGIKLALDQFSIFWNVCG